MLNGSWQLSRVAHNSWFGFFSAGAIFVWDWHNADFQNDLFKSLKTLQNQTTFQVLAQGRSDHLTRKFCSHANYWSPIAICFINSSRNQGPAQTTNFKLYRFTLKWHRPQSLNMIPGKEKHIFLHSWGQNNRKHKKQQGRFRNVYL